MTPGTYETAIITRYAEVRKRIAYPEKPPVVRTVTQAEVVERARPSPPENVIKRGRPPSYSRLRLRQLYLEGRTFSEMAVEFGVTARAIRKVVRQYGWTR